MKIYSVEGNTQKLDGGAMFGNAPRAVWQKWIQPDELGRIPLSCRCLLAQIDGKNILCETGIGAFFEPKLAERFGVQNPERHLLLENLEQLNIKPNDIDYVILSHLHFDHAGGLLTPYQDGKEPELLFENAKYVVGEEAFQRSENPHPRDRASYIAGMTDKLKASQRLVVIPKGKAQHQDVLPEHIEFLYSHGHTPGQMHTLIKGKTHKVLFAGDLVPGTHWVHLPITMGYDRFAEKVIDEKTELYKTAEPEQWYLFYTHDDKVAASTLAINEKHKYIPKDIVTAPLEMEI